MRGMNFMSSRMRFADATGKQYPPDTHRRIDVISACPSPGLPYSQYRLESSDSDGLLASKLSLRSRLDRTLGEPFGSMYGEFRGIERDPDVS